MAEAKDLSRWNRAGLSRFRYVNGNAATYVEDIRARLAASFPGWQDMRAAALPGESESARVKRLEAQYQGTREDMLWNILRGFARSTHVLTEYADAYANEAFLGTATQWENLRRLVHLLDYHPGPPSSAFTTLALTVKEGQAGVVSPGFAVKYAPPEGGEAVVFETLEEIAADAALNVLRPLGYNRHPAALSGSTLVLAEAVDGLKTGEPLVLEDERTGSIKAYLIQGVAESGGGDGNATVTVTVSPPLSGEFMRGYTLAHVLPKDKVLPLAPKATGAVIGKSLQLKGSTADLQAGEVVIISTPGKKERYRRIQYVEESRLVLTEEVGDLALTDARLSRPVTLAVAQHGHRKTSGGAVLDTVYAPGDWTRLAGRWAADNRFSSGKKLLPVYEVMAAKYVPAGVAAELVADDDKPGYTALTLRWHADEDGVDGPADLSLSNPQQLLIPPLSAGPWEVDAFLQKADGHLPSTLVTAQTRKTAPGDLAVVVQGRQTAWSRLQSAATDLDKGQTSLRAESGWEDRGGGPFYLSLTRVYAHFKAQVRLLGWNENPTPISGKIVPVEALPEALNPGRTVLVRRGEDAVKTVVVSLIAAASPPRVVLQDAIPAGCTYDSLEILGNAVLAGHGETRAERVLGSGDATQLNQAFTLEAENVAFIPDSSQPSGVAAAITVTIESQTWTQVGNLRESGPADSHYTVRLTEDGYLRIAFGDGRTGRRLPTGTNNVRIAFRQGTGSAGNIGAGSLIKAVKPHRLIEAVDQFLPASGGADRESVASLRQSAPAAVLTLQRAVSLKDFALLMRANSMVAQARAFALPTGYGQRENIEVVVIPAGGADFTPDLQSALESYALAAALPGVQVKASAYGPVLVTLKIVLRVRSAVFDVDEVGEQVKLALESAFSLERRELGQPLYRGEIFQVVEAIAGVENSDCRILFDADSQTLVEAPTVVTGADGVIRLMRPGKRQAIHLAGEAGDIQLTVEEYGL